MNGITNIDKDVRVNGKWYRVTMGDGNNVLKVQAQYTLRGTGGLKTWLPIWDVRNGRPLTLLAETAANAALNQKEDVITAAHAKKVAAQHGATLEWDRQLKLWFVANDQPDTLDTNYTYISGGWPLISEKSFVLCYVERCMSGK